MSADQLFNPERYRFCQEFAEEIITVGESHGHQLEDLLNPSDFPLFKLPGCRISAACPPRSMNWMRSSFLSVHAKNHGAAWRTALNGLCANSMPTTAAAKQPGRCPLTKRTEQPPAVAYWLIYAAIVLATGLYIFFS